VRAQELETLARLYAIALSVGRPAILSDQEVARIAERLKSNGAAVEARIRARPTPKRASRKRRSLPPPQGASVRGSATAMPRLGFN
jgi:hypothetical protein